MAKKAAKSTTLSEIEEAIVAEGLAFYQSFQKRRGQESVYAFLFEISAVGYAVAAAIATEQALEKYVQECLDDFDGDIEAGKKELRWASPEDGWYQSEDKHFKNSNKLLGIAEEHDLYPVYDGTLEKLVLSALKRMDAEQAFGSSAQREKIVIGVCHTGGDNSEKDFIKWATAVNPASVIKRLKAQLKK